MLDRIYPKLKIDLVMVEGEFNPGLVDQLSRHFGVLCLLLKRTHARTHARMESHRHARTHSRTHARTHARMQVPKNFMFIACPGDRFPHDIAALGGVRLITY